MSVQTEYKCDICKATQPTSDQFWTIAVRCVPYSGKLPITSIHTIDKKMKLDVCRGCCEELNLVPDVRPEEEKQAKPYKVLTLEDIIRKLIQEEMEDF